MKNVSTAFLFFCVLVTSSTLELQAAKDKKKPVPHKTTFHTKQKPGPKKTTPKKKRPKLISIEEALKGTILALKVVPSPDKDLIKLKGIRHPVPCERITEVLKKKNFIDELERKLTLRKHSEQTVIAIKFLKKFGKK